MIPMRQSLILLFSLAISLLLFTSGAGAFPLRQEPLDNSLFLPLLQRSSAATLSYDQRKVVMDAIEARVQSQPGEDPAAEQEAMAEYIRSLPHTFLASAPQSPRSLSDRHKPHQPNAQATSPGRRRP